MRTCVLLTFAGIPVLAAAQRPVPAVPPPLHVQVDSAHHRVLITGGPYRVPVSPEMSGMMMDMPAIPVQRFAFPMDGWIQGFRVGNANLCTGMAGISIIIPDISGLTGTRYGPPVIRTRWCVESTCTCSGGGTAGTREEKGQQVEVPPQVTWPDKPN